MGKKENVQNREFIETVANDLKVTAGIWWENNDEMRSRRIEHSQGNLMATVVGKRVS